MTAATGVLRPLGHLASALVLGPAWLTLLITTHQVLLAFDRRDRRVARRGGSPDLPPDKAIEPDGGPPPHRATASGSGSGRPGTLHSDEPA